MEQAILKTLAYADIFDYPLKAWEIHKWLIEKRASLSVVEKGLEKLLRNKKIEVSKDYFVLQGRRVIINKRIKRESVSTYLEKEINFLSPLFKIIPWVKLIGISGNLAVRNADKKDDIDLFIITQKNRIWLSRVLLVVLLTVIGRRRYPKDRKGSVSGKICINLIIDENSLSNFRKDLYTAHEILQMKPLWQRDNIYKKFLESNLWCFNFLPNWTGKSFYQTKREQIRFKENRLLGILEHLAKIVQLGYMHKPQGQEKIKKGSLYFHPFDYRSWALSAYHKKLDTLSLASRRRTFTSSHRESL